MLHSTFFHESSDAKTLFRGYGSFGEIMGKVQADGQTICNQSDAYKITCQYEKDENGVYTRNDVFKNISDKNISVSQLKSRFIFEGGEYEIYTQYCTWQTESSGMWQPLNTAISVGGASTRTIQDGAPFMALWNLQTQRGVAIHLVPNAAWEIKVMRVGHLKQYTQLVVELGIADENFNVTLAPGEAISMPQLICYEFKNKLDMDCYKLHHYLHARYPRREMPVIYDTWMYCFDHVNYENIAKQISLAADLGVEYFFIDAGWFGKGKDWENSVGDWSENTTGAFCGRMIDIANEVRAAGMKFGLWIEPERAMPDSDSFKNHPEYYIQTDECCFLDFANDEAREWMLGVIFDLIDRYGIEYLKDDYNANLYFDQYNTSFLKYYEGHKKFVKAIRDRYPDL